MGHTSRQVNPAPFLNKTIGHIHSASSHMLFKYAGKPLKAFFGTSKAYSLEEFDGGDYYVARVGVNYESRFIEFNFAPAQKTGAGWNWNPPKKLPRHTVSMDFIAEARSKSIIVKPENVVELIRDIEERETFVQNSKEHMWVIGLDTRNSVRFVDLVSLGTLNYNLVHPRETFRRAVHEAVASIIMVHNHPSENPEFSDEDISLLKRFTSAGQIMGIQVLDFMVYANGAFRSAKKDGLM